MAVAGGRGRTRFENANAADDHTTNGFAGLGMFFQCGVLDALPDLVALGFGARFRRDGLVNVSRHSERMTAERSETACDRQPRRGERSEANDGCGMTRIF